VNIADGILLVAVLILLIALLGMMRETTILREHVTALSQLITDPPAPSFLGRPLPAIFTERLPSIREISRQKGGAHIVLFVKTGCFGCEDYIAALARPVKAGQLSKDDISCVVVAPAEDSALFQGAQRISNRVVLDPAGDVLRACEVRGTPAQYAIQATSLEVFDYTTGGDLSWIQQRLQRPPAERLAVLVSPT